MQEDNPLVQSVGYGCLVPVGIIILVCAIILMLLHADGDRYGAMLVALVGHKVSYERRNGGRELWRITRWTFIGLPIYVREDRCE